MKPFETFRENFAIAYRLNGEICLATLIYWLVGILCWIFFIFEANNFIEYTTSIYIASASTVVCVISPIVIYQKKNIFELIDRCEEIIQNGKKTQLSYKIF